jgi:hypothetical protein
LLCICCSFRYLERQREVAPIIVPVRALFVVLYRAKCDVKNRILKVERRGLCTSTSSEARLEPRAGDVSQLVFASHCANALEPDLSYNSFSVRYRVWLHPFMRRKICLARRVMLRSPNVNRPRLCGDSAPATLFDAISARFNVFESYR